MKKHPWTRRCRASPHPSPSRRGEGARRALLCRVAAGTSTHCVPRYSAGRSLLSVRRDTSAALRRNSEMDRPRRMRWFASGPVLFVGIMHVLSRFRIGGNSPGGAASCSQGREALERQAAVSVSPGGATSNDGSTRFQCRPVRAWLAEHVVYPGAASLATRPGPSGAPIAHA